VHTRYFLRRYMLTNTLLDVVRTRRGLTWGVPVMLLAIPYLYVAGVLTVVIRDGGPGWLNLLVILAIWNALQMIWIGPI
ncbi:sulfate permease, partial [Vibrio cholerae O1]|nr:sulfate permease [Vibrio cholerae O1]